MTDNPDQSTTRGGYFVTSQITGEQVWIKPVTEFVERAADDPLDYSPVAAKSAAESRRGAPIDFGDLVPERLRQNPGAIAAVRREEDRQQQQLESSKPEPKPNDDMDLFRKRLREKVWRMKRTYNAAKGEWE